MQPKATPTAQPLSFDDLVAQALQLSAAQRLRLMEQVLAAPTVGTGTASAVAHLLKAMQALVANDQPGVPKRSFYGLCADLGPAPSAEEIDAARAEAWGNFPRTDI